MAFICKFDPNNPVAAEMLDAADKILDGLAIFQRFEATRAGTMNEALATFVEVFGVTANAQAFSDRLGAVNAGTGTLAALREMCAEMVEAAG
jgi:hypothetical protein